MITPYFEEELTRLRELGTVFSKAHPSIAPMLSGPQSDPDVERLLEGTAFLTALLRQKLDDYFPEMVQDLFQMVAPQHLNSTPSTTILQFEPKSTARSSTRIPAGVFAASVPVEGTACLFQTTQSVEMHPLTLQDVALLEQPGQPPAIQLTLELNDLRLSDWRPESLRLFLCDDYARAADVYLLLRHYCKRIHVKPIGPGESAIWPANAIRPVGFYENKNLMPQAAHVSSVMQGLQDYFVLPQKYLFLDIVGWDTWRARGSGHRLTLTFELENPPFLPARLTRDHIALHATPAINVFPRDGEPIFVDHRKTDYPVRPSNGQPHHFAVHSVDEVKGFAQGSDGAEQLYQPFECFRPGSGSAYFHLSRRPGASGDNDELLVSLVYPPRAIPVPETLSLRLSCTNGKLPERLKKGDISIHASGCPEYVSVTNLTAPTPADSARLGGHALWRLLSYLSLGYQSLENLQSLKSLLELYVSADVYDYAARANRRRIEGIERLSARGIDRMMKGSLLRGRDLLMSVSGTHFASRGDLYLFGCVLDRFFSQYASINSFTRFVLRDSSTGGQYAWPLRSGNRPLL